MSLKIGEINYTNIMPMFFYLNRTELVNRGFIFEQATPSELNNKMSAGLVDVGGISSFEYARNPDEYMILPELSVSSIGSVGSIFMFSKKEASELNNSSIALTSSSATSVHLLKLIMSHYFKVKPSYTTETPSLEKMLESHDACLLIGDDAIRASWKMDETLYKYDLGKLWYEWMQVPMTYALFAVRKKAAEAYPESLQYLFEEFHRSKLLNMERSFDELTQHIKHNIGGEEKFWIEYFQQLHFGLTNEHITGLNNFFDLLAKDKYINSAENIKLWAPIKTDFSNRVDIT
ncbi:menaquinone biosynthesis protein [Alkalicoccus daliensis]|uniref:Chorismate dehydratase n=1 Tax=Alkalicoccus daliensis TaxID=745820 RepID=A0A1H0AWK0_9BACI|nr:menaquinone biosynthesis protein [Alkalicoccus daliensis]SDN37453.1 futalosine synthase [Alkalicoccus daliensis]